MPPIFVIWLFPLSLPQAKNTQHEAQQSCLAFSLNCEGRNLRSEEGEKVILRQKTWQRSRADGCSSLHCWQGRCYCLQRATGERRGLPLALWSSSLGHLPPSHHFRFRISRRLFSCNWRMARSNSSRNTEPATPRGMW